MTDDLDLLIFAVSYVVFSGRREAMTLKEAAARIAALEAALLDVLPYVDTCNSSHREAQAKGYVVLTGGKE